VSQGRRDCKLCCNLGIFRIDPEADPAAAGGPAVFLPLAPGVENDMVGISDYLVKFPLPKSRGKGMDLTAELLPSEPGFEQAAGAGPLQVFADQGKEAEHRESLQGQEDPAAGPGAYLGQDPAIILDPLPLNQIAGRFQMEP